MGRKITAMSYTAVSTDGRENVFMMYADFEVCAAYEIETGKEPGLRNTKV